MNMLADVLTELSRREKERKIKPDPDLDFFMKVLITPLIQNYPFRLAHK